MILLKHPISSSMKLYIDDVFGSQYRCTTSKRYEAVIGIGGNMGDVRRRFHKLFYFFKRASGVTICATGPILKNPPFGFLEQEDFLNSVLIVKTNMQAEAFLRYLLRVEKKFGRRRSFENAPRTLDLDLIFFDTRVIENKFLTLPHPHWQERESVVIPLNYLQKNQTTYRRRG